MLRVCEGPYPSVSADFHCQLAFEVVLRSDRRLDLTPRGRSQVVSDTLNTERLNADYVECRACEAHWASRGLGMGRVHCCLRKTGTRNARLRVRVGPCDLMGVSLNGDDTRNAGAHIPEIDCDKGFDYEI